MKKKRNVQRRQASARAKNQAPDKAGSASAAQSTAKPRELSNAHGLWQRFRAPVAVLAAALLLHGRTLRFGFTYLDDTKLILDRLPFLQQWSALSEAFRQTYLGQGADAYYRPLVTLTFALDAHWSGRDPFGYHLTNLALHGMSSVLVFLLLRRLRFTELPAALGALLFAVHPALVETVAWIPGRNDLLLAIFGLAAWLCLAPPASFPGDDHPTRDLQPPDRLSPTRLVGHAAFFMAALLTKETAIALPVVYAAYIAAKRSFRDIARSRRLLAAWIAGIVMYLWIRASVAPEQVSFRDRLATLISHLPAVISSVGKLVLPVHLAVIAVPEDTPLWPGVAALLGLTVAFFVPGARRNVLAVGVVTLVAPLLPATLASEQLVLENRLYLPAVGVSLILAEVCRALASARPERVRWAALAFVPLGVLAWRQESLFQNQDVFTAAGVEQSPHSALAHVQRGVFDNEGAHDSAAAERDFRRAAELKPTEPLVHNNLGVMFLAEGRLPEAEAELRAELAAHPKTALAHYNLGLVLMQEQRPEEAVRAWQAALEENPDHVDTAGELYAYYMRVGNVEKAESYRRYLQGLGVRFGANTASAH